MIESKRETIRQIKEKETLRIVDTDTTKILFPLTERSAKLYGSGTKWCTTSNVSKFNKFADYAKQGKLYIIILDNVKFVMHVECGQLMNELNLPVTDEEIEILKSYNDFMDFYRGRKEALSKKYFDFFDKLAERGLF